MDHEELKNAYWDQVVFNDRVKYRVSVKDILKNYNFKSIYDLKYFFKENNLGKFLGICKFCNVEFYFYSRAEYANRVNSDLMPCGHIGFCKSCKSSPVSSCDNGYCERCWVVINEDENKNREADESIASIDDFNHKEVQALAYMNNDKPIEYKGSNSIFKKLSFALNCSLNEANEVFASLINKFGLVVREKGQNMYCYGVNKNLDIPLFEKDKSYIIVKSPLAQHTYSELSKIFPHVFVEVPFAGFADFDLIQESLSFDERRHFFNKRLDFVCCDHDFEVLVLVEYNGRHHFSGGSATKESRKFKKKMSDILGLEFIEINSPDQICTKLNHLRG